MDHFPPLKALSLFYYPSTNFNIHCFFMQMLASWSILHDPRTKLMATIIHKTTLKYLHSLSHLCSKYQLSLWNKVRWLEINGKHNRLFCTNLICEHQSQGEDSDARMEEWSNWKQCLMILMSFDGYSKPILRDDGDSLRWRRLMVKRISFRGEYIIHDEDTNENLNLPLRWRR